MSNQGETAYVTGGASGIGKATATMLVKKGIKVFIADRDTSAAESVVTSLNSEAGSQIASCGTVDTSDWNSQAKCFTQAVSTLGGRIDYVYPIAGIGERRWLPMANDNSTGFEAPDLTVLDVDLKGVLYTVALAVQQFRRQDVNKGFRGKIGCVASVCGFYCSPTLPVYTAAKHGLTGFVRSYGKYLVSESMGLNAVNPNVVRTAISTTAFYDSLAARDLLTPIDGIVDTFSALLNDGELSQSSGEIYEIGPNYGRNGQRWVLKDPAPYLDEESRTVIDLLEERAKPLQTPA